MIVYLDTSVILRRFLGNRGSLRNWGTWDAAYTSELARVEYLRTIDRLRLDGDLTDGERVQLHERFRVLWDAVHRVALTSGILESASEPFPTVVGTLDALHLASALAVAKSGAERLLVLTHDAQLGRAASAVGFQVDGLD